MYQELTYREMAQTYQNDCYEITKLCIAYMERKASAYRRIMLKQTLDKKVIFNSYDITSPVSSMHYILQPFSPSKKAYKQNNENVLFCYYMCYESEKGIYVVIDNQGYIPTFHPNDFTILSPHFFERYNERYLHREEYKQLEVIKMFFCNNQLTAIRQFPRGDYEDNYYTLCEDGVALGRKKKNVEDLSIYIFDTYITNEMLRGQQVQLINDMFTDWKDFANFQESIAER